MFSQLFLRSSVPQDQLLNSTDTVQYCGKRMLIFLLQNGNGKILSKKIIMVLGVFNLEVTRLHYLVALWYSSGLRR